MKVLVTGASGFVGRHAVKELAEHGHSVVGVVSEELTSPSNPSMLVRLRSCDITQVQAVYRLIEAEAPDAILHLAGISHVVQAADNISRLLEVNCLAVKTFCDAINRYAAREVIFLLASTGLVYGPAHEVEGTNASIGASENTPVYPRSAYARSKLAAELILETYTGTKVLGYIARPFNHTGPGQSTDFVCPGFARKILDCRDSFIKVGNLEALRDICDARDIVRAYRLILEKRPSKSCFVLGSGRLYRIRQILDQLIDISGKNIQAIEDKGLLRSNDTGAIYADSSLAQSLLDWAPQLSLQETLRDLYWDLAEQSSKKERSDQ